MYDWSGVTRLESCVSGVRCKLGWGGRILRWYSRRGGNVTRWQLGKGERVVSRKGRMEFKDKIVLHCSREAK